MSGTDSSIPLIKERLRSDRPANDILLDSPSNDSFGATDVSVLRRLAKGFGANAYDQAVTVLVQIFGVPILLHAWGARLYGEWLILFAIPAYLSLSDLGFSQSAGNEMTARVVRGDRAGAARVFQSLARQVYIGCAVALAGTTLLIWKLPIASWLQLNTMSPTSVRVVLCLAAAEMFVRLPNGVTDAGFRAGGDYALHVFLTSTARLLQFAGIWGAALAGGSPVAGTAAFFCVRLFATPFSAIVLHYRHGWLLSPAISGGWRDLHHLAKPAIANLALPLANALNIQGMVLVVGAVLGPVQVVVFSTLRTLTRLAVQLVMAVNNSAEPEIAAAHGSGDRRLMHALLKQVLSASMWLALAAATMLALFGNFVVRIWTHGAVQIDKTLFALLLLSAVASVLWYGSLIVLKAANRHLRASVLFVAVSSVAVGLAGVLLWMTRQVQVAGVTLLLMDGAMVAFTLREVATLLDLEASKTIVRAVNPTPLVNATLSGRWRTVASTTFRR